MPIKHIDLGFADYKEVWDMQKETHLNKQKNPGDDILFTVEHNHVYTLGKTGSRDHILISDEEMKSKGISYYEIDRGGDITYHGPGQLVAYPILELNNYYKDTHRYLRDLEETVILTLNELGIEAHREEEYTGVWVGDEKICAIGIKVSRWITMHGIAFNINTDLSYFDKIIPCGIFHKGVTSVEKITGAKADFEKIREIYVKNFENTFQTHQKQ
ncbi:MAG: lipoyl(octanoyl) transferase LipB [Ignavibacteria bacterium]|nr:lipoyl(octanoyl) transferase LipB [Ignavibacteria bacterium]